MRNDKNTKPKILIIGHARHGKDTLAEIWQKEFGMTFESSSMAAAKIFIYDLLKEQYGYSSIEECFEDRVNHRGEWHNLICDYNENDKARLAKGILENSDCYVGMRSNAEVQECLNQGLFDLIVWVDATSRQPLESMSSFNIDVSVADIVIDNDWDLQEFKDKAIRVGKLIFK